ncbi:hypothetical protein F5888DRAFT_1634848 [Russula emetica]|nr:hypothetical protein F5888DRAFT_1634848 [Russula emetica]
METRHEKWGGIEFVRPESEGVDPWSSIVVERYLGKRSNKTNLTQSVSVYCESIAVEIYPKSGHTMVREVACPNSVAEDRRTRREAKARARCTGVEDAVKISCYATKGNGRRQGEDTSDPEEKRAWMLSRAGNFSRNGDGEVGEKDRKRKSGLIMRVGIYDGETEQRWVESTFCIRIVRIVAIYWGKKTFSHPVRWRRAILSITLTSCPLFPPSYLNNGQVLGHQISLQTVTGPKYLAGLRLSIQRALIRSIDGGAEMQHPENPITVTSIDDEGLPVIRRSASGPIYRITFPWSPSKATSTDSAISNEGQIDINLVDGDTDRSQSQEGVLMNAPLGHGCQYTRIHTTSNPQASSIPQGISSKPTVVQYLGERASRDRPQKLQKSGNVPEKASSQSPRPPAGIGGALNKGPYPCDICGKRAHLKTKHSGVVSDAAQDGATSTSYRVATASSLQQRPVLTLTPEHGQRGGTETWWCPLIPPPSAAEEVARARLPAKQCVDHDQQPLGSAEPTVRRKRKREDAPESELRTELQSAEVRAQLAKDLDMPVRKVQTWSQDEGPPRQGGYGGNLVVGAPADEPCGPHVFPSCSPTHYEIRKRHTCSSLSMGGAQANIDPTGTIPEPSWNMVLGPDTRQNSGTGTP